MQFLARANRRHGVVQAALHGIEGIRSAHIHIGVVRKARIGAEGGYARWACPQKHDVLAKINGFTDVVRHKDHRARVTFAQLF